MSQIFYLISQSGAVKTNDPKVVIFLELAGYWRCGLEEYKKMRRWQQEQERRGEREMRRREHVAKQLHVRI